MRWVDRDKSLRKQLEKHHDGGAKNAALFFNVQYYVTNVSKLEYEITRCNRLYRGTLITDMYLMEVFTGINKYFVKYLFILYI